MLHAPAFSGPLRWTQRNGSSAHSYAAGGANMLRITTKSSAAIIGRATVLRGTGTAFGWLRAERPRAARAALLVTAAAADAVNVLVVGGGGREHALCWRLRQSPTCGDLFCSPGNAGIAREPGVSTAALALTDHAAVAAFCKQKGVGLVVIGPEAPLVDGLADSLTAQGIPAFGPSKSAARLEGSKGYMKDLCARHKVPTAAYDKFTDPEAAKRYIKQMGAPIVVKADGLAAGKGVVVARTVEEACEAADSMLVGGAFGEAGNSVVVEEFLDGEEASFFALVDGDHAVPLASCQDHKAVGDGDTGPNTGGMGAYSPAPVVTPQIEQQIMKDMILPTVRAMKAEGSPFVGVLFAGVMVKDGVARLLEYNVRFGDPECQVLMLRLRSDLVQVLLSACRGQLSAVTLDWAADPAVAVVMAARGYPGAFPRGEPISGLDAAAAAGATVFHAGTAFAAASAASASAAAAPATSAGGEGAVVVSAGGRVLVVAATGATATEAAARAYAGVDKVVWPGGFSRRDIAYRAIARERAASSGR